MCLLAALRHGQVTWTAEEIEADEDGAAYDTEYAQAIVGGMIMMDGIIDLRRIYLSLTKTD